MGEALSSVPVASIAAFMAAVEADYSNWGTDAFPWFRGEPGGPKVRPLLPKLYRRRGDGRNHDENALLQFFRMKAPILGLPIIPDVNRVDQWLFLARHVGLPTRLLDWTEGALIALYFALQEEQPVVWMLNPHALNQKNRLGAPSPVPNEPTITWVNETPGGQNLYALNIRGAWELDRVGAELPVAVHPTNIHPRMSAQHSCFTVHGKRKEGLAELVGPDCLRRYDIQLQSRLGALRELRRVGISESTLFPEPTGLAKELEQFF